MAMGNIGEKSENNFKDILDLISEPVIVLDERSVFLCVNKAFESVAGHTATEIIGKTLKDFDFLDGPAMLIVTGKLVKRLQGENIEPYDIPLQFKGKTYDFEPVGKRIDYLGAPADLIVLRNITERKNAELKLHDAETRYQALFKYAPLGVLLIDPETTAIVEFNDTAYRKLGYTKEEFSKLHITDLEVAEIPNETLNRMEDILRFGQHEFITKHRTKSGGITHALINARVVELAGKKYVLDTWYDVTGLKKLRTALRTSEEKFRGIANAVSDPMLLVDEKFKIIYWNPAAENTFGYTSEEALGKEVHELVASKSGSQEKREYMLRCMDNLVKTDVSVFPSGNIEVVGRRRDCSEFPAELSISPIKLSEKWHVVGLVKDITVRKRAQLKLEEAEQRYHALFNQAPIGVMVIDPETAGYVEFNDIAHIQLGYSRREFEKIRIFDIQAEESPEEVRQHLKGLVREGSGEFETLHRTKTGQLRNVIVTIKAFQSEGKTYLHGICHDITESKRAQKALLKSQARYRQLVEVAQEGIWAIDKDTTTVFVNPRMAKMLGYTESEMIGRNLYDFIDKNMVKTVSYHLGQFNYHNGKGKFEYAFPCKDGNHVETSLVLSNIRDGDGYFIGTLAVVSDITERKRAEKALKESEELSRAIVANAPIGIATAGKDYYFQSANETFCKILGYTEQELKGLTFKDVTHPEDLKESTKMIRALEAGKIPSLVQEKKYVRNDGTAIIGRVIVNIIRTKDQNILYIVKLEDITERQNAEEKIRSLAKFPSEDPNPVMRISKDGALLYANGAAKILLKDLKVESGLHALPQVTEHAKEVMEAWQRKTFEVKHGERTFLFTYAPIANENYMNIYGIDITETKRKDKQLNEEREKFETFTQTLNTPFAIIGKDYRIQWANKFIRDYFGKAEGKLCYTVFANVDHVCPDCGVAKVFNGSGYNTHEYTYVNRQQQTRWVEIAAAPLKDEKGNVVSAIEIALDITEKKQLQKVLSEYSQKLEKLVEERTKQLEDTQIKLVKSERLAAIGELAGMIGHDLRNPLTGIKNSAYFMKKKSQNISEAQVHEMLEIIDKCVDYSNRIITDLLDYSKELRLEAKEESAKQLLVESLRMLDIPKKIQVIDLLSDEIAVKVDADKIKRVFINLIKNAVEAMPNGGKLTIEGKEEQGYLSIAFADTGVGISEEVLPKLFTPLFTTKAQGMGFGLAICKRIIEAHNGTITVHTAKGKGTKFRVTLPTTQKLETGGEKVWINVPESSLSTTTRQSEPQ